MPTAKRLATTKARILAAKTTRPRASLYTEELAKKAVSYFNKAQVPTISGLADHLGVCRETLYIWESDPERRPEFATLLRRIMTRQEARLIAGGLSGELNAQITKLMLAKHGYHSMDDTTHRGDASAPLTIQLAGSVAITNLSDEEASARYYAEVRQNRG